MSKIPVPVPMLNANEPEARLVDLHIKDGQHVEKDALLFTIETTKVTAEVLSPAAGYIRMVAEKGATLGIGAILAYLTNTPDEAIDEAPVRLDAHGTARRPYSDTAAVLAPQAGAIPVAGLRITQPARSLAESLGLDLASLPTNQLVTEAVVRKLAASAATAIQAPIANSQFPDSQLIIYGAGGHAKAVLEMARAIGTFQIIGIVDDNKTLIGTSVLDVPVLGGGEMLPKLIEQGYRLAANGVGGIVNIGVRIRLFERLSSQGFTFPSLCHPRATVETSARLAEGVQVFANAYVGSDVVLHERCMINTAAIVSHDCEIGAYTHIAPGALLAGHVHVGAEALVGMGVTTIIGLKIGAGARIGNGAVLLADVPEKAIVPAGKVWNG